MHGIQAKSFLSAKNGEGLRLAILKIWVHRAIFVIGDATRCDFHRHVACGRGR